MVFYIFNLINMFKFKIFRKITSITFLTLSFTFALNHTAIAKPNMQPLKENIADTGSAYYQFKIQEFKSQDQMRTYNVWLGIPKKMKQNISSPAIFMLDGNAVMARLNESVLQEMSEGDAPVLVAIGYKTNLPFQTNARSLDYTPADATGKPAVDPRNPERMSGGSDEFRQVVMQKISPWVESQVKLDAHKKALWGHSYGGLFVLDMLLNDGGFSHYFAASPSLAWADQRMLNKILNAKIKSPDNKKLLVMEGDVTFKKDAQQSPNIDHATIENNRRIVSYLHHQGVNAKFMIYPDLSHGEVFAAALNEVLRNRLF